MKNKNIRKIKVLGWCLLLLYIIGCSTIKSGLKPFHPVFNTEQELIELHNKKADALIKHKIMSKFSWRFVVFCSTYWDHSVYHKEFNRRRVSVNCRYDEYKKRKNE